MSSAEFFGILAAIISVGVTVGLGLATLIIRGQHRTDARIDALEARTDARFDALEARTDARFDRFDSRLSGVETGLAELRGFLAGAGFAMRRDDPSSDD